MSLPIFNELLNRAIALDPHARAALRELSGTTIAFHLEGIDLDFDLQVIGDNLIVSPPLAPAVDARVSATPVALLRMLRSADPARALFDGAVQINGRRDKLQRLSRILQDLEIDWEEQLSKWVGDLLARRFGNQARAARAWAEGAAESMRLDTSEYLLDELMLLAKSKRVQQFAADVDTLRDDVARLEARIRRLQQRGRAPS